VHKLFEGLFDAAAGRAERSIGPAI